MTSLNKLLFDLFERTSGEVTISDIDGTIFTSDDLAAVADEARAMKEPFVDLVTTTGEAIGILRARRSHRRGRRGPAVDHRR
jgi:hypothetical protein